MNIEKKPSVLSTEQYLRVSCSAISIIDKVCIMMPADNNYSFYIFSWHNLIDLEEKEVLTKEGEETIGFDEVNLVLIEMTVVQ